MKIFKTIIVGVMLCLHFPKILYRFYKMESIKLKIQKKKNLELKNMLGKAKKKKGSELKAEDFDKILNIKI